MSTPQDRIRLKTKPVNVAVPQGAVDLYVDTDGSIVKESPDGTKTPIGGTGTATVDNESVNTAIAEDPAASRAAMGAAASAIQSATPSLASSILVHDAMLGDPQTMAATNTRAVTPGPGTATCGALSGSSLVRYERGELILTGAGTLGQTVVHYGAQTAAAGLTIEARIVPAFARGGSARNSFVGFSSATNIMLRKRGNIAITQSTGDTYPTVQISAGANNTDETPYHAGSGIVQEGEEIGMKVQYDSLTKQTYWMQGGRYALEGAILGSDHWIKIGETFMDLTGQTVYPMVAHQFMGTTIIRDVRVYSSSTPSNRHQLFDYSRTDLGTHIPSMAVDPISGLLVLAYNKGTAHGGQGLTAIRGTVRLANGSWTAPTDLMPSPVSPAGQGVYSLSVIGGVLKMIYEKATDGAVEASAIIYWRDVSINPTTGAITLGTEQSLGINGLAFSPIITLPNGRLILPFHINSGGLKAKLAYSDDGGASWTSIFISNTLNLVEPTLVLESDGALGCIMRSYNSSLPWAYYSRCVAPQGAGISTWTSEVAVKSIPQPIQGSAGSRMQYLKRANGEILLIGNDTNYWRRNMTIWRMGDNGTVLGKTLIGDHNSPQNADGINQFQYPVMVEDVPDNLVIAASRQYSGGGNLSMGIQVDERRWTAPIAPEIGGTGSQTIATKSPARSTNGLQLAYAATMTPDMSLGSLFYVTLTGTPATGIAAPLNPLPWETLKLCFVQGGSGSYTCAFNSIFEFGAITPTWQTAVNATNWLEATYNPITGKWIVTQWR